MARTYAAGGADFFDGDAVVRSVDGQARVGLGHRQHVRQVVARLAEAGWAGGVRPGKKHETVAIGEERALADDRQAASLMGIDVNFVIHFF